MVCFMCSAGTVQAGNAGVLCIICGQKHHAVSFLENGFFEGLFETLSPAGGHRTCVLWDSCSGTKTRDEDFYFLPV